MIEIYNLPTAKPYLKTATYWSSVIASPEYTYLNKVVVWETKELVDNKFIGIVKKVQISTSELSEKPSRGGRIKIDDITYSFQNPVKVQNPAIKTFWESEIKEL